MKPRTFAVGERVRVFHRIAFDGKIDSVYPKGRVSVIEDGFYSAHDDGPFHPRQCVKLIKKAKPEPRRVWIAHDGGDGSIVDARQEIPRRSEYEWTEFVEVLKPGGRRAKA